MSAISCSPLPRLSHHSVRLTNEWQSVYFSQWCLHNEQKKLLVDMKFSFSCSTLTSECNKREKMLSTRVHLLYFMIEHYHLEEDNG